MNEFDPVRSLAIRGALVRQVAAPDTRRHGWRSIGLVVAGAVLGGGVAAGAFAATEDGAAPSSTTGVMEAPAGVLPGADIASVVGDPISVEITDVTRVPLDNAPGGATDARVSLVPLTPGTLTYGPSRRPNQNASASFTDRSDVRRSQQHPPFSDVALSSTAQLWFRPTGGFTGTVTVQYLRKIPTKLGVNAAGQTYGVRGGDSAVAQPDLVAVGEYADGQQGYVLRRDLEAFSPEHPGLPSDPAEVDRWQRERQRLHPDGWDVPVYLSDGTTRIGTFRIDGP